jgi:hypothetical protein
MRKTLTTAALVAVATGAFVAGVAGPAAAETPPAPECRTASTTLTNRPDQGFGGVWANDTFIRTVKFCETGPATRPATNTLQIESATYRSTYTATVTDEGAFTTVQDAKSPNKAVPITAVTTGKMAGGFTATFKAKPGFVHYTHPLDGKTVTGDAGPSTPDWVKAMWGDDEHFNGLTNMVAWHWSFWTCSDKLEKATEHWTNADPEVNEGDITGKACPTPTATATPTAAATPSTGGQAGGLPVTGSNTGILAGGAVLLVAVGAGLFLVGHRRRKFTA